MSCALLAGCAANAPTRFELDPLERGSAPREPLPDPTERLAEQMMLAALDPGADPDVERGSLQVLQQRERERLAQGEGPSGLLDNATDLFNATLGDAEFARYAEGMLESGNPDAALERKLRGFLENRPLEIAERRLAEDRRLRLGLIFNRLISPAVRGAAGDPTAAIEGGRALLYTYTVLRSTAQASVRERQALRAYDTFLKRNPGSPQATEIAGRVDELSRKLRTQRLREALRAARSALGQNRPDGALIHLARAEVISPEEPGTARLRALAQEEQFRLEQRVRITLAADADRGSAFASLSGGSRESMVAEVLRRPLADFSELLEGVFVVDADFRDEAAFIAANAKLASGDETGYFQDLSRLASQPGNMARHAASVLATPEQNPYQQYLRARSERRSRLLRFVFLGSLANGLPRSSLPGPLLVVNRVLETPLYAVQLLSLPFRLLQIPSTSVRLNSPVIDAGELYLSRFPEGEHSQEIHRWLESAYVDRSAWSQALVHHRARDDASELTAQNYRDRIAERTLEFARLEDRPIEVRLAVYSSLVREYGDTPAGKEAGPEAERLRRELTPQSIRLTKRFLLDYPAIWGVGALGLRPELLDGDEDNGELSEDGVRLIGRNYVEISFEDGEPTQRAIPEPSFRRFVSLIEEARYRTLAGDARERPVSEPMLDLFLERARLGLLSEGRPDLTARAESVVMTTDEKFSGLQRAQSILPVELVVRGGLNDAGLAAIPRIVLPEEPEDAPFY